MCLDIDKSVNKEHWKPAVGLLYQLTQNSEIELQLLHICSEFQVPRYTLILDEVLLIIKSYRPIGKCLAARRPSLR